MALSSSGAISFSQIQTEFGGSNPISLSEYYSGSLPTNTGSTTSYTTTTGSYSITYTSGKNTYIRQWSGWCHSSISPDLNTSTGANTTESVVINERSLVDIYGNAGTVPSSGTIGLNHFRGTSAGTISETYTLYGIMLRTDAGSTNYLYIFIDGHRGTAGTTTTFTGAPFASISTSALSGTGQNMPATTIPFTTTASSNGFFNARENINHLNNSTIGNYTEYRCRADASNNNYAGNNGNWTQTINH